MAVANQCRDEHPWSVRLFWTSEVVRVGRHLTISAGLSRPSTGQFSVVMGASRVQTPETRSRRRKPRGCPATHGPTHAERPRGGRAAHEATQQASELKGASPAPRSTRLTRILLAEKRPIGRNTAAPNRIVLHSQQFNCVTELLSAI